MGGPADFGGAPAGVQCPLRRRQHQLFVGALRPSWHEPLPPPPALPARPPAAHPHPPLLPAAVPPLPLFRQEGKDIRFGDWTLKDTDWLNQVQVRLPPPPLLLPTLPLAPLLLPPTLPPAPLLLLPPTLPAVPLLLPPPAPPAVPLSLPPPTPQQHTCLLAAIASLPEHPTHIVLFCCSS